MALIYEFRDYRKYLERWIGEQPQKGRGQKSALARAANCHITFVSQVLGGLQNFSPEQAHSLNEYLKHSSDESEFFLNLVLHTRAGTHKLKSYYEAKLEELREKRQNLSRRLDYEKSLGVEEQNIYFSSWLYAAVHLLTGVPRIKSAAHIARELDLPLESVNRALEFLLRVGLIEVGKQGFKAGRVSIHLGKDSTLLGRHHANWRMRSLHSLEQPDAQDFHYSSAVTIRESDARKIREAMIRSIEEVRKVVKDSPEEKLYCYTFDFFKLSREPRSE